MTAETPNIIDLLFKQKEGIFHYSFKGDDSIIRYGWVLIKKDIPKDKADIFTQHAYDIMGKYSLSSITIGKMLEHYMETGELLGAYL